MEGKDGARTRALKCDGCGRVGGPAEMCAAQDPTVTDSTPGDLLVCVDCAGPGADTLEESGAEPTPTDAELAAYTIEHDLSTDTDCTHTGVTTVPYGDTVATFHNEPCDRCVHEMHVAVAGALWDAGDLRWVLDEDGTHLRLVLMPADVKAGA